MNWTLAFLVLIGVVFLAGLWPMVKHGGWRGALFGAKISETVGDVSAVDYGIMRASVRVHKLEGADSDRDVGVEIVAKSPLSYQVMGASLTTAAARDLISKLEEACRVE